MKRLQQQSFLTQLRSGKGNNNSVSTPTQTTERRDTLPTFKTLIKVMDPNVVTSQNYFNKRIDVVKNKQVHDSWQRPYQEYTYQSSTKSDSKDQQRTIRNSFSEQRLSTPSQISYSDGITMSIQGGPYSSDQKDQKV